jgi:hypothetical protein
MTFCRADRSVGVKQEGLTIVHYKLKDLHDSNIRCGFCFVGTTGSTCLILDVGPRFLFRPTALYIFARAVGRPTF